MADREMNKLPLDLLEHVSGGRLSQMDRDAMDMFIRVEKKNHGSRDSLIRFMQRYVDANPKSGVYSDSSEKEVVDYINQHWEKM